MSESIRTLSRARTLSTGSPLDVPVPTLVPHCESEAELEQLITAYYKFFNEGLSQEVSFLTSITASEPVQRLRRLIYSLRTATNHSDNATAISIALRWRRQFLSPQLAADALAAELERGIQELARIAVYVSRVEVLAARWRDSLSIDVPTVFDAVATDLGRSYSLPNRLRMIRTIEKRLEVRPAPGDRRTVVAEYCAQEMISDRRPLPVPYSVVLDALNLIGSTDADAALLAAHSVASISPRLRGDEFVERVLEIWRLAGS